VEDRLLGNPHRRKASFDIPPISKASCPLITGKQLAGSEWEAVWSGI
jgi:hypothetical protein